MPGLFWIVAVVIAASIGAAVYFWQKDLRKRRAVAELAYEQAEREGRHADALQHLLALAQADGGAELAEKAGMYLLSGKAGIREADVAVLWLERSAKGGRAVAQRELGLLLLHGDGAPQEAARGVQLLTDAAHQGDEIAKQQLDRLASATITIPAQALQQAMAGSQASAPEPPALATEPAAPRVKRPVLKLKHAGVRHRVSAADGEILIGREPGVNILVAASHVSRRHATIIWDGDGNPLLVNLSKSGTSVQPSGQPAMAVDGSLRLEGEGRIGLAQDFAFAEAEKTVVTYESKLA
jgi:hypothetical protein